jgi:hypothetical protein
MNTGTTHEANIVMFRWPGVVTLSVEEESGPLVVPRGFMLVSALSGNVLQAIKGLDDRGFRLLPDVVADFLTDDDQPTIERITPGEAAEQVIGMMTGAERTGGVSDYEIFHVPTEVRSHMRTLAEKLGEEACGRLIRRLEQDRLAQEHYPPGQSSS